MPTKREEDPERCCVVVRNWPGTMPIGLPSSSLHLDHEDPSRARALRAHRRPDGGGERNPPRPGVNEFPEIPQQEDVAIVISVIEGASKGLTYQLSKLLCITVGRIGGGADFEFDEPEASDVHCIIAARENGVRLYVAPSANNIYVNDRRICTVELAHMSTFRIGSSLLLVTVFPTVQPEIR